MPPRKLASALGAERTPFAFEGTRGGAETRTTRPHLVPEIFAISFALLLFEVSYTRVFAYKLPYFFTYFVLGVCLLGLGASAATVAAWPRLRGAEPGRVVPWACLLAGLAAGAGYPAVARIQLNAFFLTESPRELLAFFALAGLVFLPFFAAGIAVAKIFSGAPRAAHLLYGADLLGAALGAGASVPLLLVLTPPGAIEFAGLLLVLASLRLGRSVRGLRWTALAAFLGLSPWVVKPDLLPDAVTEWPKTLGFYDARRVPAVFTRWHPIYRVDVVRVFEDRYFINHDGAMASALYPFSGDLSELRRFETDSRSYPFAILGPGAKVLVVGAAGGQEILASLYFGASEVTAVEVNPVTVSLLTDHFADYTGHLAEHPRVRLVNAEGRAFVSASREKWDLVWFVAPDSYTAVNAATSSAFVLTESYLYTVEMIEESLRHLTDRGIVCAQFGDAMYDKKPNRTARYVSTAREAFRRLGVEDFEKHVLVATSPDFWGLSTILLKRRPFTRAEVEAFLEHASKLPGNRARLAPGHDLDSGPVRLVASLSREELESFLRRHPYRLDPVYDDAPFFWHFARFLDAFEDTPLRRAQLDWEDGLGERVLVVLAGVSAVFAVLVLSVPVLAVRSEWKRRPRKLAVAVYFGGLGLGFMFVEVCLIQQFTLLLGFPTYSLTVTLATLLVSAGLGSLSSGFWGTKFRFLVVSWCLLAFWVALLAYGLPATTGSLLSLPMWVRVPTVVLAVLPLGLVMGGFLPFGLRRIAEVDPHPEAYVAWAWAVNAFASVVGSVVATILAMGLGFSKVRWAALGVYALGILAFRPFVRGIR